MNNLTDQQLLRDYSECRSEPAFAELVRRHVDLVYSAALRMVRDDHLAKDVTQGVFVALAQNAEQLTNHPVMSGWLHCTARNLAAKTVRTDARRRVREQEAAAMNELLSAEAETSWDSIAPHLDAALGELNESDRDALLLRYFERKSATEMAGILGISDEAAQKRVSRAVDRLREIFSKRNVTIGAGGLVVLISANAVQSAPIGLAISISTAALAGTVTTSTAIAVTKTIAMTTIQKTLITATIAVVAGAGIYETKQAASARAEVHHLQQQQASMAAQVQKLQKERDDATNQLSELTAENINLTSGRDTTELLKLRGEVAVLRRQNNELKQLSKAPAYQPPARNSTPEQTPADLPVDYPKTADGAARGIFELMARGDWNSFTNFDIDGGRENFEKAIGDKMKDYLRGMEIVSIGEPTNSFGPNMWFVPYTIRFQDGNEKSHRLHVAQDPNTRRWILKGGF